MFHSRFVLRTTLIPCKLSAPCKCTSRPRSNGKSNVIKTFNLENKELFGNLLETQKQRRHKSAVNPNAVAKKTVLNNLEDTSEALINPIQSETKKKSSRKLKKSEDVSELSEGLISENKLSNGSSEDNLSSGNSKLLNSILREERGKKSKKSKCKEETAVRLSSANSEGSLNPPSGVSDKFIFKSAVPLNEQSYSLDNPDKIELSTNSCSKEDVLNYGFTHSSVKDYLSFPSVSKIMEDTMSPASRMILSRWRKNMTADLGEEGFTKHCTVLKERGHEFHEAVKNTVLGRAEVGEAGSEVTRNALRSLEWVLQDVSSPLAVESIIAHPLLQYKGIPDCVAMFRNVPVVIDWKLSDKPKKDLKDTYDAPVQITAYMGALNHDPNYKWKVSHGLVAVAYTSGDPCDVFLLAPKHCEIYWRHWLLRYQKFKSRSLLHVNHEIDEKALESV